MIAAQRDLHGLRRLYYRPDSPFHAASIRQLLRLGGGQRELDRDGVLAFLDDRLDREQTCVAGVRAVPGGHRLEWTGNGWQITPYPPRPAPSGPLAALLLASLATTFATGRAALALSGGLDSALLLALGRVFAMPFPIYVLDPQLPDYSEVDRACATAKALGFSVIVVPATERDFIAALPECIRHAETPFYNLHPVSKYLLARRLRADGIRMVVTGDGADQVFAGVSGLDYLPLVGALFESQGVEVRSPFLDEEVIAFAGQLPPDPNKSILRALARELVVPDEVIDAPKVPRLAPPMDLSSLWDERHIDAVARLIGRDPPRGFEDSAPATHVRWTTLGLLRRIITEDL
jgi:asparagine synthetase B (glutamine-hydrolysing)